MFNLAVAKSLMWTVSKAGANFRLFIVENIRLSLPNLEKEHEAIGFVCCKISPAMTSLASEFHCPLFSIILLRPWYFFLRFNMHFGTMTYCFRDFLWCKLEEILLFCFFLFNLSLALLKQLCCFWGFGAWKEQWWRVPIIPDFSRHVWSCCSIFVMFRYLSYFCSIKLASSDIISEDQKSLCMCPKGLLPSRH